LFTRRSRIIITYLKQDQQEEVILKRKEIFHNINRIMYYLIPLARRKEQEK
jgi:hypothetical protein